MNKVYILYHHPCSDGTGAKYAAWKKYGNSATYIGVEYKKPMPELESGAEVYIIDFSYPKQELRKLHARSEKLVVLDHHKSAMDDLVGEPYATFNMDKSGAVLAWEYFHPDKPVPSLLEMIQDRDLWRWKVPNSKNFLNYLESYGHDVETWDAVAEPTQSMFDAGATISAYQLSLIQKATQENELLFFTWPGTKFKTAMLNTTNFPSEIGNAICMKYDVDFSTSYFISKDGVVCLSFRSLNTVDEPFDVIQIASKVNGGGHRTSSGGRTTLTHLQFLIDHARRT